MRFDFAHIAVPFRMQPGLHRLAAGTPQLTPLAPGSPLYTEKQRVFAAGASRFCEPGFDPTPAIKSIAAHATTTGLGGQFGPEAALELAFEEDLAVLDAASGTVPWLCVCVPSHWAPEDKLGQSLAAIHGPVADNAALLAATRGLTQLVGSGGHWERFVWTVTPASRYDQHPHRQARTPWPATADAQTFAQQCYLRAERQTFLPVGQGTQQAVFTIRVMLQPLAQAVQTPPQAARLHDALASMSDAVVAYKNLAPARPLLLRWLATRMASGRP